MELIVFSGIQGAGKTTFYNQRFARSHVHISLDVVGTRNREDIILHACLAAQQSVVIDNTNPTVHQRARYAALGKATGFRTTLYFFDVAIEVALSRNAARSEEQRIPEVALRGTFAKLERPTATEGFDSVHLMRFTKESGWIEEELSHEVR